jgi:hypothetical protein
VKKAALEPIWRESTVRDEMKPVAAWMLTVERELTWIWEALRKMVEPKNRAPTREDVREAVEM